MFVKSCPFISMETTFDFQDGTPLFLFLHSVHMSALSLLIGELVACAKKHFIEERLFLNYLKELLVYSTWLNILLLFSSE
jgi:hypothetical protein